MCRARQGAHSVARRSGGQGTARPTITLTDPFNRIPAPRWKRPVNRSFLQSLVNQLLYAALRVPFVRHDLLQSDDDEFVRRDHPIMGGRRSVPTKLSEMSVGVPTCVFRPHRKAKAKASAKAPFSSEMN